MIFQVRASLKNAGRGMDTIVRRQRCGRGRSNKWICRGRGSDHDTMIEETKSKIGEFSKMTEINSLSIYQCEYPEIHIYRS